METKSGRLRLFRLLSLRGDQAEHADIDAAIRSNAALAGTNLWVLMFAIVIASVGLNVNSTAVIIGAMLISPLMGPIIAIGYGAAVFDYGLIRSALRTLAFFVCISLLASTTYFLVTPLSQAQSELLARTSPTLWDVLIAFFGGAAGMVGLTRKEKTTLIPGVAIATALMPPLCTVGYGIATWQPSFFVGAFYLFLINGVFIALSSLVIARVLRLPQHPEPNEALRRQGRIMIVSAVLITLVPSVLLAYQLVRGEMFTANAERVLRTTLRPLDDVTLLSSSVDPAERAITLTLIGSGVTPALKSTLESQLATSGLTDARLTIRHPGEAKLDVSGLKQELQRDLLSVKDPMAEQNAARVVELESQLRKLQRAGVENAQLEQEIIALLPEARGVVVAARSSGNSVRKESTQLVVVIDATRPLLAAREKSLRQWLKARLPGTAVHLVVESLKS